MDIAGIYGPVTVSQIKDGKHLYRALEAHFSYMSFSLQNLFSEDA